MSVNLNVTLDWPNASGDTRKMLEDLQGNILKGHGRAHTALLFLNFGHGDMGKVRPILRSIGRQLECALDQLRDARAFKQTKLSAGRFLAFYLSNEGYAILNIPNSKRPGSSQDAFRNGMQHRANILNDPPASSFDEHLRQANAAARIHGLLLIADDSQALVNKEANRWETLLGFGGIAVIGRDIGHQHFNKNNHGIENFGYVDGRSQPLFLTQDITDEGTTANWDPAFPLSQVLVHDPGGEFASSSFGSFFVFRKLEQNVKGFKDAESEAAGSLADALGLKSSTSAADDRERAGAMVVGRFEDGTPFVVQKTDGLGPINDFNFASDPNGANCPFRSHIRKSNPRGESVAQLAKVGINTSNAVERSHIMARRGITYGERQQDAQMDFTDRPTSGVGLLFMAYMSSIENQFEFTQASWVNNPNFVTPNTGIDPVIGQGKNPANSIAWPDGFGHSNKANFDFKGFVTLKGGEYFFAPSKSFLTNI
jgi:Dyp-type peroxidase family